LLWCVVRAGKPCTAIINMGTRVSLLDKDVSLSCRQMLGVGLRLVTVARHTGAPQFVVSQEAD